ncbi:DUF3006 domain-containing protein [Natronolimnobius baerhuensis]|uniref:DUF3006 domain-containing protein n=1 Tax=Natronolimnobius baerhuensis TaxID=253108 RepID=A0A202EC29_9EURY|nr:DUF3006 domain-containing protein [Natronolimnobius baerhuensis]OVE85789.1 DUF3006 domain-containing protein [Natronolimnobius baerhuensis]
MKTTYTAVLDRIVDGETAVFLLEDDGEVVDERTEPITALPAGATEAAHEGAVFELTYEDETLLEAVPKPAAERERRERTQDRFDRLSERLPGSDDEERNESGG